MTRNNLGIKFAKNWPKIKLQSRRLNRKKHKKQKDILQAKNSKSTTELTR